MASSSSTSSPFGQVVSSTSTAQLQLDSMVSYHLFFWHCKIWQQIEKKLPWKKHWVVSYVLLQAVRGKGNSSSLLAAHSGKEVVCPTCSCHFMGFPALQLHVNKVHNSNNSASSSSGSNSQHSGEYLVEFSLSCMEGFVVVKRGKRDLNLVFTWEKTQTTLNFPLVAHAELLPFLYSVARIANGMPWTCIFRKSGFSIGSSHWVIAFGKNANGMLGISKSRISYQKWFGHSLDAANTVICTKTRILIRPHSLSGHWLPDIQWVAFNHQVQEILSESGFAIVCSIYDIAFTRYSGKKVEKLASLLGHTLYNTIGSLECTEIIIPNRPYPLSCHLSTLVSNGMSGSSIYTMVTLSLVQKLALQIGHTHSLVICLPWYPMGCQEPPFTQCWHCDWSRNYRSK
jgi:hypothetical protein